MGKRQFGAICLNHGDRPFQRHDAIVLEVNGTKYIFIACFHAEPSFQKWDSLHLRFRAGVMPEMKMGVNLKCCPIFIALSDYHCGI
jgi:hypothetical protein